MEKEMSNGNSQLAEVKLQVINAIRKKYGMSVAEFSKSKYARGLELSPNSIASYLAPNGVISYPFLKVLCDSLNLGELKREVKVVRTCTYKLVTDEDSDKAVSQNRRFNRTKGKA